MNLTHEGNGGTHLMTVSQMGKLSYRSPGFYIYAFWLPSMGFIPGSLVQVLPDAEGMVFNLRDENIRRYSELDTETKTKGGKLLQVFNSSEQYKQSPTLLASGQFVHDAGFSHGDTLIAKYTYGHIRVRKLLSKSRVILVSSIKDQRTGKAAPKIHLMGFWLSDYGFIPDSLTTVFAEPGSITFTLRDEGVEKYRDLVSYARKNKMKLLQVRGNAARGKLYPLIVVTGSCVEKAGFIKGEPLIASCDNGIIKLQRLDIFALGF